MDLSAYLSEDEVVLLAGRTKKAALEELMDVMAQNLEGVGREELGAAVWKREEIMSTGIGHGLGVPHVRMAGLGRAYVTIGISHSGIQDYESLDGEPVHVVVLIAAPAGEHETYIRLLATAADVLKQDALKERILHTTDIEEIYQIFTGQKG
jgi:mannitol/fructose-specific phosphotransferase system IIA component (Ntr-type)